MIIIRFLMSMMLLVRVVVGVGHREFTHGTLASGTIVLFLNILLQRVFHQNINTVMVMINLIPNVDNK